MIYSTFRPLMPEESADPNLKNNHRSFNFLARTTHPEHSTICLQPPRSLECRPPRVRPPAARGCSYRTLLLLMYKAANGAAPLGLQALVRPHARLCSASRHSWSFNPLFPTTRQDGDDQSRHTELHSGNLQ